MGNDLDGLIRNYFFFRDQYGVLGSDGGCFADCHSDECGVLELETETGRSIQMIQSHWRSGMNWMKSKRRLDEVVFF